MEEPLKVTIRQDLLLVIKELAETGLYPQIYYKEDLTSEEMLQEAYKQRGMQLKAIINQINSII